MDVVGKGSFSVVSSPARADTDLDGISDYDDYNRFIDGVRKSTDPRNPDTEKDGISDLDEINGYTIKLRFPGCGSSTVFRMTDPLNPDTDGDTRWALIRP